MYELYISYSVPSELIYTLNIPTYPRSQRVVARAADPNDLKVLARREWPDHVEMLRIRPLNIV